MLRIIRGKGFHITLHGWTFSVQFGAGNYCTNYEKDIFKESMAPAGRSDVNSPDAEIALWQEDGDFIDLGGDTVMGRVPSLKVGQIIGFLASGPKTEAEVRSFVIGEAA